MKPLKILPVNCPSCGGMLTVKNLSCPACETQIDGNFDIPVLSRLEATEQQFILSFVKHSGSLKQMARELSLSYPTVRNRLDDIISRLQGLEASMYKPD